MIWFWIWFSDTKNLNIGSNKKMHIKFEPTYVYTLTDWNDLTISKTIFILCELKMSPILILPNTKIGGLLQSSNVSFLWQIIPEYSWLCLIVGIANIKLITSISYPIVWLVSRSPMTSGNSFTQSSFDTILICICYCKQWVKILS